MNKLNRHCDEQGGALLTVIILITFLFAILMAVAATAALSLNTSNANKNELKAFSSAEAGRDRALTEMANRRCYQSFESTVEPKYKYEIYKYIATADETPTTPDHPGVEPGCPDGDTTHVIVATTGSSHNKNKLIYTTYKWNRAAESVLPNALTAGSGIHLSGMSVVLPPGSTMPGNITLSSGDFDCNNATVQGSVFALNGRVLLNGCNRITGNASSSESMEFPGNTRRVVDGNACARSYFRKYSTGNVGGTARQYASNCEGLDGEGWIDYNPSLAGSIRVAAAACSQASIRNLVQNATVPTIFDITNCSVFNLKNNLNLKTDVTLVGNSFDFSNISINSADGAPHMFNIVIPDKVPSSPTRPDCSPGQGELKMRSVNMELPMSGLMYSPCVGSNLTLSNTWTGQIQIGQVTTNLPKGQLVYVPVAAPVDTNLSRGFASSTILSQVEPGF